MEINCSVKELLDGVRDVKSAVPGRTTLPVLSSFLVEAVASGLKMTSTDMQIGVRRDLKAEVKTEGAVAIPAKKFGELLSSLPESENIKISMGKENSVILRCGKSRFTMQVYDRKEYPLVPEHQTKDVVSFSADDLLDMLERVSIAVSPDEARYVLCGVSWKAEGGNLRMAATDGRRMAMLTKGGIPSDLDFNVIIPTKMVSEMTTKLDLFKDDKTKVDVSISKNSISFQAPNIYIVSRLLEGSYPKVESVVPAKTKETILVPRIPLLDIVKRAALCAPDRGGSIKFKFGKGKVGVSSESTAMSCDEEVDAEGDADRETNFDPRYVVDGLRSIVSEKVQIKLAEAANSAVLIEPVGDNPINHLYVVMPMRS